MSVSIFVTGDAILAPLESPASFLGGLPAAGTNKVSIDTVYGQLPRPAVIPRKVSLLTKNEAVRETYLGLYEGHFRVRWQAPVDSRTFFKLSVFSLEDAPGPFAACHLMTIFFWRDPDENSKKEYVEFNAESVDFKAALTLQEKMKLSHRLLHLFLRCHGATVPPEVMDCAYTSLSEQYIRRKWYEGPLDITMIYVDVAINCDRYAVLIGHMLKRVGETLESLGRFTEAAQVYKETADQMNSTEWKHAAFLYDWSGLAFKRAKEYERAEEAYVTALHMQSTCSEKWDINNEKATHLITNMLMLYYDWRQELGNTLDRFPTETEKMDPAFSAILYFAGFQAGQGGLSHAMIMHNGLKLRKTVKRNMRSRAGAKQVLVRAASSPGVMNFRQEILSCLLPGPMLIDTHKDGLEPPDYIEDARKDLGKGNVENETRCGNPSCGKLGPQSGEGSFLCCPCNAIHYCGKECQITHWKAHKAICVWQAGKKAGK